MPFLPGDVYTDKPMTQSAIKLFQGAEGFVARSAAPRMPVTKLTGSYYKWKSADFNRNEMVARGPNSPTPVAKFGKESALFSIQARALAYNLNDWVKLGADQEINPADIIPAVLSYKAALSLELMFSAFAFSSASWYRTITGVASAEAPNRHGTTGTRLYLSDTSTDPIKAIREERIDGGKRTGFRFDAAIFGAELFEAVAMHEKVRSTLTNGSSAVLRAEPANEAEIARLCGLDYVRVASGIYNTALENETESNDYIVPAKGLLLYRRGTTMSTQLVGSVQGDAGVMNPEFPTAMVRAQWDQAVGNTEGFRIRTIRDEDAGPGGSSKYIADSAHDFVSVNSKMGVLWTGMLA